MDFLMEYFWPLIIGGTIGSLFFILRYRFIMLGSLPLKNKKTDKNYDRVLSALIDNRSIVDVTYTTGNYYIEVVFQGGYVLKAWNKNKYYAWLKKVTILGPEGETILKSDYMVSCKTMYKLRNKLKKFGEKRLDPISQVIDNIKKVDYTKIQSGELSEVKQ